MSSETVSDQDVPVTRPPARGFLGFRDLAELERCLERRDPLLQVDRRTAGAQTARESAALARELGHDLRQPLAAARAVARALQDDLGDGADAARERLAQLERHLQLLSETVGSVLEPAPPQLVGLVALCRHCCTDVGPATGPAVELLVEGSPVVAGDPVELRRLLQNLLANARRAAGAQGRVRLRVSAQAGVAVLTVEDSGTGTGTADVPGGQPSTGLGLLIVSGIARRHGGTVDSAPGELGGLMISVRLPVALPLPGAGGAS